MVLSLPHSCDTDDRNDQKYKYLNTMMFVKGQLFCIRATVWRLFNMYLTLHVSTRIFNWIFELRSKSDNNINVFVKSWLNLEQCVKGEMRRSYPILT